MQKLNGTKSNVEWDVIMMGFHGRRRFLTQGTIGAVEGVGRAPVSSNFCCLYSGPTMFSDSDLVRCLDR